MESIVVEYREMTQISSGPKASKSSKSKSKSKSSRISFFPSAANKIRLAPELYYTKPENEAVADLVNGESFKKTTSGALNRMLDQHAAMLADACPLIPVDAWEWLATCLSVKETPKIMDEIYSRLGLVKHLNGVIEIWYK